MARDGQCVVLWEEAHRQLRRHTLGRPAIAPKQPPEQQYVLNLAKVSLVYIALGPHTCEGFE